MNPGAIEEGAKVATSTIESMRSVPLAIALLIVNLGFLAFAAYLFSHIATNAQVRDKTQTDLIQSLVKDCLQSAKPQNGSILFSPRPPTIP